MFTVKYEDGGYRVYKDGIFYSPFLYKTVWEAIDVIEDEGERRRLIMEERIAPKQDAEG